MGFTGVTINLGELGQPSNLQSFLSLLPLQVLRGKELLTMILRPTLSSLPKRYIGGRADVIAVQLFILIWLQYGRLTILKEVMKDAWALKGPTERFSRTLSCLKCNFGSWLSFLPRLRMKRKQSMRYRPNNHGNSTEKKEMKVYPHRDPHKVM